jgi:hypothetical protein
MIQMDVGGLPPIPTGSFWQFSVWQFFSSFRVPNFWGRFEALNNVFRAHHSQTVDLKLDFDDNMCIPRIDLSNGLSCA